MIEKIVNLFSNKKNYSKKKSTTKNDKPKVKRPKKKKIYFFDELNDWTNENLIEFRSEYNYYKLNCCPNCGVVLDTKITRSRKCNSCNEKIILRTNRENSKKLLLTEQRSKQFDKNDEIRKEIIFMENIMKTLNARVPQYMYKFYDDKKNKPYLSPRDYTFSFANWVMCEIDRTTYHKYSQCLKLSFQDRVLECDKLIFEFKKASYVYCDMIKIVKYKKRDDTLIEMLVSLLYRNVAIAHLPYFHWEDRPFAQENFYSDSELGMNLIIEYMKQHNMNINDLKEQFMQKAHPFIMDVVPKDKAWNLIENSYYHYLKLIKTGKY